MATGRPSSILSHISRAVKSCRPTTYRSIRCPPSSAKSQLHTSCRRAQTAYPNRYGPAATDALPPPPKPSESLESPNDKPKSIESPKSQLRSAQPTTESQSQQQKTLQSDRKPDKDLEIDHEHEEEQEGEESELLTSEKSTSPDLEERSPPDALKDQPAQDPDPTKPLENKELDLVLSIPSPSEIKGSKPRHPHLEPSPYEHHFDTYTLVQELAKDVEAYTEEQAITIMKAVRLMLSINLDLAKEGLVSKSNIENESYLFRAACSELRTTLQGTRASENQQQRTSRGSLQHELDILNQRVTQDILSMREELKGMFNDRKMGLQEEKRKVDTQISELNYKITVLLNSEAKSEVEGLRWVLTRRAALAIGTAAFMTLVALQYYSVKSREQAEIEKKRAAAKKVQEDKIANESQNRYTTPSRDSSTQTEMREYEESLG